MPAPHYLYISILFFSILFPFILSFIKPILFYKKWKALVTAHVCIALFFCIWDIFFTYWGVWGFNPNYIVGLYLINLPVEEVLFFICIPYCCLFIYENINHYMSLKALPKNLYGLLAIACIVPVAYYYNHLYTSVNIGICALLLVYMYFQPKKYYSNFLLSFAISLIPFFIVNGMLTGGFTSEPVVWYDNHQNLGIRIGSIPVEDIFYGFNLLFLNTLVYEYFKKKWLVTTSH